MQVIHFYPSTSFAGLEQYAFELAAWQLKQGMKVAFVVSPDSRLEKECKSVGIQTIAYKWSVNLAKVLEDLVFQGDSPKTIFHLHGTHEIYNTLLFRLKNFRRVKDQVRTVLQFHLWILHRKKDIWHRWLYGFVDEIWCSSHRSKESLAELLPVSGQKIKVLRYGRPVEALKKGHLTRDAARQFLKLETSSQKSIVNVASFHPLKGQRELVESYLKFAKNLSSEQQPNLYFIGGARENDEEARTYYQATKTLAQSAGKIGERIHFLGPIENANRCLKAFDLFVLPSHLECFSLAVLDAQLFGLPVIGTSTGGTPDVVIEGKAGWLSEPNSANSLLNSLQKAWSHQSHWEKFGKCAQERVQKEFDQEIIFNQITQMYVELFKGNH